MAQTSLNSTGVASSGSLVLQTNGSTSALTLDTAQNVGVGVTPSTWNSLFKAIDIGTTASFAGSSGGSNVFNNAYWNGSNYIYKTTAGAARYLQSVNEHFWYNAASGTAGNAITFTQAMTLDASGNLAIGATSASTKLHVVGSLYAAGRGTGFSFQTPDWRVYNNASNGLSFNNFSADVVTIDSSGNLLVGQTATGYQNSNSFILQKSDAVMLYSHANGTGSGTAYIGFGYNGGGIGSITQSGTTAVLYNVTSDQRLKENIVDADSASTLIDSLQVRKFDWKTDNTHQRYGFVAQELVTVAPEAVHQPINPDDMMAVDYSKLVPMLVKEIQSLRQRLAAANL